MWMSGTHETVMTVLIEGTSVFPSVSPVFRGQSWVHPRVKSGPIWHSVLLYTGWKDLMF